MIHLVDQAPAPFLELAQPKTEDVDGTAPQTCRLPNDWLAITWTNEDGVTRVPRRIPDKVTVRNSSLHMSGENAPLHLQRVFGTNDAETTELTEALALLYRRKQTKSVISAELELLTAIANRRPW